LLREQKIFRAPMLYLSLYFKTHRQVYYNLLSRVRAEGDWEAWLEFFAEAVAKIASQAVEMSKSVLALFKEDRLKIEGLGRASVSVGKVHQAMMERPIATAGCLVEKTGLTPATVNKSLAHLGKLGIVEEMSGLRRNRLFSYIRHVELLSEDFSL
jgi:Fic family protein